MRIMFDDTHGRRVAMECTSVSAVPDPDSDKWLVVAVEAFATGGCIIREDLTEADAKDMVRKLFDTGRLVQA